MEPVIFCIISVGCTVTSAAAPPLTVPNTTLVNAEAFAYRIKDTIENLTINSVNNLPIRVTTSIGITCASKGRFTFEALYKAADQALYKAKKNGRNCIVLF